MHKEFKTVTEPETAKPTTKKTERGLYTRIMGVMMGLMAFAIAQLGTIPTASAAITNESFDPIIDLIDAIIPLFSSIFDLIVAVFPLVIGMAFLAGLSLLINKIFNKGLDFGKK